MGCRLLTAVASLVAEGVAQASGVAALGLSCGSWA